jgi:RNA-binding protein
MPTVLTAAQRRSLRALAHHLEPVVQVGHSGITEGVVAATREALLAHELIKVRLHEPEDKHAMADALATGALATLCGLVGHTAILYRPHPKQPKVLVGKDRVAKDRVREKKVLARTKRTAKAAKKKRPR